MRRLFAVTLALAVTGSGQPKPPRTFAETVQPFVAKSCVVCHNAKLRSGELDLQHHSTPANALQDRHVWELVVQKLRSGEMPPPGAPKPKPAEVAAVAAWIEREYDRRDKAAGPDPGRVTARRLNRYEYNNTVRDLTGVDFQPAGDFPADDSGYGFDNIADVLSLSPVLMEKYMLAAEKIARRAVLAEPPQFRPLRVLIKSERNAPLESSHQGPEASNVALHTRHRFPADGDYEIRIGAVQTGPNGLGKSTVLLYIDGRPHEITGPEKRFRLTAGEHAVGAVLPVPFSAKTEITQIEIRGPYDPTPPPLPASHRHVVSCGHDFNQHEPACARDVVAKLARRAFRRTPSDHEIDDLLRLITAAAREGETLEGAVRVVLQAVLVSPHFLFRIERDFAGARGSHPISDFELASRLSYFLWSSMPDDELLDLAERAALRPALAGQVRRMLADPKARALAENFAGQWLQLRNLDEASPDPERFPDFDADLRDAMKRETELFFEAVVREDRSILDFLDAKYTYLNERLAAHYGIEGVEGSHFRRVALSSPQRSGVLTHASVLTVSSYPTRTSPVIRGKWVLENLLNAPPPPPPPNVPNLDEEAVGSKGSLRQQLELHRSNTVCASCHAKMDPLGFGLENYDAIGRWRTRDGRFPIDASGVLPNGKSFRGPAELKSILRAQKDEFAKSLTEKLLTYALGRGLEPFDRPAVQSINRRLAGDGYRFSALVSSIVDSMPFQMRRSEPRPSSL
jgi:mono/diheme cytochrome c family protein